MRNAASILGKGDPAFIDLHAKIRHPAVQARIGALAALGREVEPMVAMALDEQHRVGFPEGLVGHGFANFKGVTSAGCQARQARGQNKKMMFHLFAP